MTKPNEEKIFDYAEFGSLQKMEIKTEEDIVTKTVVYGKMAVE